MTSFIKKVFTGSLAELLPPRYDKLVALDRLFGSDDFPDIIFFGDSVVERIARQDTDTRNLGEMATDLFRNANLTCLPLCASAYHMLVYLGFVRVMQTKSYFPRAIIIPVNMRSFSPQWDLRPQWQFDEEIRILERYCKTSGKEIGRLRKKNQENIYAREFVAFRNTPVKYPLSKFNKIGQFMDTIECNPEEESKILQRKRDIFIFHYSHPLVPTHRKMVALNSILSLLCQNAVKTLLYITPVNHDAGKYFVGPEFGSQLHENVQIIKNLVDSHTGSGIRFADWSCVFDSSYFFSKDLATEHINQRGRQELSQRITNEVLALFEMRD